MLVTLRILRVQGTVKDQNALITALENQPVGADYFALHKDPW